MLAKKCQVRGAPGSPGDQATQGTCSEKVSSSSVSIRPPGGRTYSFDLRTRFEPYNKIGRCTQLSWSVLATDSTAPHTQVNCVHSPQGKSQCLDSVLFHLAKPPYTHQSTLCKSLQFLLSCQSPFSLPTDQGALALSKPALLNLVPCTCSPPDAVERDMARASRNRAYSTSRRSKGSQHTA